MRPHGALLAAGKALVATVAVAAAAWLVISAYGSPALVASLLSMFAFCR